MVNIYNFDHLAAYEAHEAEQERQQRLRKKRADEWRKAEFDDQEEREGKNPWE